MHPTELAQRVDLVDGRPVVGDEDVDVLAARWRASTCVVAPGPSTTASPSLTISAAAAAMADFSAAATWVFCE